MIITLCSIFRNSEKILPRYLKQVENLAKILNSHGDQLTCLWGEGDSTDNTRQMLERINKFIFYQPSFYQPSLFSYEILDVSHGGKEYNSVVDVTRFLQCAYAGNIVWSKISPRSDIVIWVDSDIIWDAKTIQQLIWDAYACPFNVFCPLVILDRMNWDYNSFYNVFDFRISGEHFMHKQPYHPNLLTSDFVKIDSGGSCMVMRNHIAKQVHFTAKEVIVGMCKQINELGYSIYLDARLKVYHE